MTPLFTALFFLLISFSVHPLHAEPQMNSLSYTDAMKKLSDIGEEHLLKNWKALTPEQKSQLLNEISALDPETFKKQQLALQKFQQAQAASDLEPKQQEYKAFNDFSLIGSDTNKAAGKKLIAQGKVGCLIVAGGMGTRLCYDAPKGTFPVSVIKNKSLFQVFAEKTLAAGKQAACRLPLAIMTSPQNDVATRAFFKENHNFGLAEEQLFFYCQGELPFLNYQGHLMLLNESVIAKGPDGNGASLEHLVLSGIWETWQRQGIEYVNYILVDNPLADPFDAELIGFHAANECEITLKCVEKFKPEENVGLVVDTGNGIAVVEYTEMNSSERKAVLPNGKLKHRCTNISLFCFSMNFIKRAVASNDLPWHLACKSIGYSDGPLGWKPMGFKFETYIFDYFGSTQAIKALLYPRSQCFAPLKNIEGTDSLDTVQKALLNNDLSTLESICDHAIPAQPLELDQQFHYPTEELLTTWKGRKGSFHGYITQEYITSE
jgi:UDP-N-acetylglucosamine/UDP-N-acetylgalactosamine diphosphorylase